MYLSPLSKARRQRDMNNQRIGHPQENLTNKVLIPGIFDVPSEQHYHPSTGFVQCVVTRVGNNLYHFSHQGSGTVEIVSIIGSKLKSSRTSNYHLFDSIRGGMSAKLTKKSGHYIGKLRRDKDKPVGCYTLYNASREKQELAAFVYNVPSVFEQVKEGQPPRKMRAILPKSASSRNDKENSSTAASSNANRLVEHLHNGTWKHQKLLAVQTKAPKFHEGMFIVVHLLFAESMMTNFHILPSTKRPISSKLQRTCSNSISQEHAVGK